MLLFKPNLMMAIIEGNKTQTRRLWKKPHCKQGTIHQAKVKLFSPETYAFLHITDIHKEYLLTITEKDARKEGFENKKEFLEAWDQINPKTPFKTDPIVTVITFEITPGTIKHYQTDMNKKIAYETMMQEVKQ